MHVNSEPERTKKEFVVDPRSRDMLLLDIVQEAREYW